MYSAFLETWFAFFPSEQFLVISQERLTADPRATLDAVTTFLGLQPLSDAAIFPGGKAEMKRSNAQGRRRHMLPETQLLLDEFYRPFNERLAALTGEPAFLWHKRST